MILIKLFKLKIHRIIIFVNLLLLDKIKIKNYKIKTKLKLKYKTIIAH